LPIGWTRKSNAKMKKHTRGIRGSHPFGVGFLCGPFVVGSICQPLGVENSWCQPHPVCAYLDAPAFPDASLLVSPLPKYLATVETTQPLHNSDYFAKLPTITIVAQLRLVSKPPHRMPRWSRTSPQCRGFLLTVPRRTLHCQHPPRRAGRLGP
jgi:hypothetical protein